MSEPAGPEPQPEEPYSLPGTEPALEPGQHDFPEWPMTAMDASPFLSKDIG